MTLLKSTQLKKVYKYTDNSTWMLNETTQTTVESKIIPFPLCAYAQRLEIFDPVYQKADDMISPYSRYIDAYRHMCRLKVSRAARDVVASELGENSDTIAQAVLQAHIDCDRHEFDTETTRKALRRLTTLFQDHEVQRCLFTADSELCKTLTQPSASLELLAYTVTRTFLAYEDYKDHQLIVSYTQGNRRQCQ